MIYYRDRRTGRVLGSEYDIEEFNGVITEEGDYVKLDDEVWSFGYRSGRITVFKSVGFSKAHNLNDEKIYTKKENAIKGAEQLLKDIVKRGVVQFKEEDGNK